MKSKTTTVLIKTPQYLNLQGCHSQKKSGKTKKKKDNSQVKIGIFEKIQEIFFKKTSDLVSSTLPNLNCKTVKKLVKNSLKSD